MPPVQGRFSDGKTAAAVAVEVRLSTRGVEIYGVPGSTSPLVWTYGALQAAVPLSSRAEDVLLSYGFMPGATLFVAGPDFVASLAVAAPHLTTAAQRWRFARPLIAISAVVLAVISLVTVMDLSPIRATANLMPSSVRAAIGRQAVASMAQGRAICSAPAGRAALDKLSRRLAAAGAAAEFKVVVVDWQLLNAFAVPGEHIVLTRELIEKAQSADEVAGVLAHEMGHGLERHPETGLIRAIGLAAAVQLALGGSSSGLADLGQLLLHLSYTRAAEREADQHALRLLEAAGISPQGIVNFFTRLEKIEGEGPGGKAAGREFNILRSHPRSSERARLAAERSGYPATPALSDADWTALRTICSR